MLQKFRSPLCDHMQQKFWSPLYAAEILQLPLWLHATEISQPLCDHFLQKFWSPLYGYILQQVVTPLLPLAAVILQPSLWLRAAEILRHLCDYMLQKFSSTLCDHKPQIFWSPLMAASAKHYAIFLCVCMSYEFCDPFVTICHRNPAAISVTPLAPIKVASYKIIYCRLSELTLLKSE